MSGKARRIGGGIFGLTWPAFLVAVFVVGLSLYVARHDTAARPPVVTVPIDWSDPWAWRPPAVTWPAGYDPLPPPPSTIG